MTRQIISQLKHLSAPNDKTIVDITDCVLFIMPILKNTFVSFINENGDYCIGQVIKLSKCGLVISPLERCRVPELGEKGSVVLNFGEPKGPRRALTAWAEVGDASADCIDFYFREMDSISRKMLLEMIDRQSPTQLDEVA